MECSTAITHAARRIELSRALVRSDCAVMPDKMALVCRTARAPARALRPSQTVSRDLGDVRVLGPDLDLLGLLLRVIWYFWGFFCSLARFSLKRLYVGQKRNRLESAR
jgi:hypothetical protein